MTDIDSLRADERAEQGVAKQPDTLWITLDEYMVNMGKAVTAYTQVFGAVVRGTIDAKVKTGQLTPELGTSIVESIGKNLITYMARIEERLQAKLAAEKEQLAAGQETVRLAHGDIGAAE